MGREDYPASGENRALLVASNNRHKVEEIRRVLGPLGFAILRPADLGIRLGVAETGSSFAENAQIKAIAFSSVSGMPALADDSGLVVDALGGEPGVFSARYGGPELDDQGRYELVLRRMSGVPERQRTARFVCALALVQPGASPVYVEGSAEGWITGEPRGSGGFGYDPIFFSAELGKTFGEALPAEKDAVGHRGRALRSLATSLSRGAASYTKGEQ